MIFKFHEARVEKTVVRVGGEGGVVEEEIVVGLLLVVRVVAFGTERVDVTVIVVALIVAHAHKVAAHGELCDGRGSGVRGFRLALEAVQGIGAVESAGAG